MVDLIEQFVEIVHLLVLGVGFGFGFVLVFVFVVHLSMNLTARSHLRCLELSREHKCLANVVDH